MANTLLRNCYTKQVLTFFLSRYRCTNQLVIFTPQFGDKSESRHHRKFTSVEKKDRNEKGIGSSSVFFQDGTSIQELPLIVCKCQTFPSNNCDTPVISSSTDNRTEEDRRHECLVEEEAVKDGFTRCSSLSEIFKLLDIIPVNEVTPKVASHALKCISQLHINSNFKNMSDNINNVFSDGTTETFCWNAIIERLCETVRGSSNVDIILEALQALCVGKSTLNRDVNNGQCQQLINECLLRVAEGCVSLDQTLALALIIHSFASRNKLYAQYVDKLWISILNNYNLINETNISQLFSVVPIFKTSRKTILNILVKRTLSCWWKLKVSDIITILSTFVQVEFVHHSVLRASTKWLNVNIHAVSENDLASIINLLLQLNYMDSNTIRAAEKYIRLCHTNIRNMELVALWADVCVKFRICSPTILDTFTLICTDMKRNFSPSQVFRIARTFGLLNYIPLNNKQFFAFLEDFLSLKFAEFKPDDMIELLLSCTFIQRYPLNFVQKVLNPFFLDRLNRK